MLVIGQSAGSLGSEKTLMVHTLQLGLKFENFLKSMANMKKSSLKITETEIQGKI